MMEKLSVVIPVYNSEKTIAAIVNRVEAAIRNLKDSYDYEIICVNDGSRDNSANLCRDLSKENSKVKFINLAKNFGQLRALMAGFGVVSGDYIICLDDDGQNPPEEIHKLIDCLKKNDYDVVFSAYEEKQHSKFRNLGSTLSYAMANALIEKPKDIKVSSFFISKKFIIKEIIKYENPYPYLTGLFFRVTKNVGTVLVDHKEREFGSSGYSLKKLVSLLLDGFTNFSIKPLRVSSVLGMTLSMISLFWMLVLIIRKLISPNVSLGWTSIMVTVIFFGGIQLMSVGLLGEYIGRIYLCINKTPQYVIRETCNIEGESDV